MRSRPFVRGFGRSLRVSEHGGKTRNSAGDRGCSRPVSYTLWLLPRHGNTYCILWRNQVICSFRNLGDRELNPFNLAVEGVALRAVVC